MKKALMVVLMAAGPALASDPVADPRPPFFLGHYYVQPHDLALTAPLGNWGLTAGLNRTPADWQEFAALARASGISLTLSLIEGGQTRDQWVAAWLHYLPAFAILDAAGVLHSAYVADEYAAWHPGPAVEAQAEIQWRVDVVRAYVLPSGRQIRTLVVDQVEYVRDGLTARPRDVDFYGMDCYAPSAVCLAVHLAHPEIDVVVARAFTGLGTTALDPLASYRIAQRIGAKGLAWWLWPSYCYQGTCIVGSRDDPWLRRQQADIAVFAGIRSRTRKTVVINEEVAR